MVELKANEMMAFFTISWFTSSAASERILKIFILFD